MIMQKGQAMAMVSAPVARAWATRSALSRRGLRLSPTYHRLQDLGCYFGEKTGWERPNWFKPYEEKARHGHEPKGWAHHNW
jgi:4-methylaminobutanoate oxidase (formaldehyde-forming)